MFLQTLNSFFQYSEIKQKQASFPPLENNNTTPYPSINQILQINKHFSLMIFVIYQKKIWNVCILSYLIFPPLLLVSALYLSSSQILFFPCSNHDLFLNLPCLISVVLEGNTKYFWKYYINRSDLFVSLSYVHISCDSHH